MNNVVQLVDPVVRIEQTEVFAPKIKFATDFVSVASLTTRVVREIFMFQRDSRDAIEAGKRRFQEWMKQLEREDKLPLYKMHRDHLEEAIEEARKSGHIAPINMWKCTCPGV